MKEIQGRPLPLGVTMIGNTMNFSVAVPQEKECQLLLYHAGEKKPCMSFGMKKSIGEVRYIALEDIDPSEYEYNYEMDGEIVVAPYVKALAGREKWGQARDVQMHEVRGKLDIKEYDWEGEYEKKR